MEIINLVEATTLAWNWKKPTRERANQRPQTLQSKTQISKRYAKKKKKKEDSRKDTHSERISAMFLANKKSDRSKKSAVTKHLIELQARYLCLSLPL